MPGYEDADAPLPRKVPMWPQVIIEIVRLLPDIIKAVEQLMPDKSGPEKLAGAVAILRTKEPTITETKSVASAREAMLSAQVAYLNAISEADV